MFTDGDEGHELKSEIKPDKKNKTQLGIVAPKTNRSAINNKGTTMNNSSVMGSIKVSSVELTSKNASLFHLKNAGVVSTKDELQLEYGEMLPKTGIYSLPDFKVTAFLRILTDYHKKLESDQDYLQAK
jgi:hypothetical protein